MKLRIFYEDTDVGAIVYHANYIKFCERARSEACFALGGDIFSAARYFVVTGIECKFAAPARLGEVLEVRTRLAWVRSASVAFSQEIWRVGAAGCELARTPSLRGLDPRGELKPTQTAIFGAGGEFLAGADLAGGAGANLNLTLNGDTRENGANSNLMRSGGENAGNAENSAISANSANSATSAISKNSSNPAPLAELIFRGTFSEAFMSHGKIARFDAATRELMEKFADWVY